MTLLRRILLLLLLPTIFTPRLSAEEDLLWLPEYFSCVQQLSDVEDGAYYLIAGTSQLDGHVLMSTDVVENRLKGVVAPKTDRIFCEDGALVWQMFRSGDEVVLRAAKAGKYLNVPKGNGINIELHAKNYTVWELREKDDGFVLKKEGESSRYLYTSHQNKPENPNPFANYSFYDVEGNVETNVLYFYKLETDYVAPEDNTITYLNEGDPVPAYGNLLVCNGALIYPSVLLDAKDFQPTQSFTVTQGQLTYTRILQDEKWETLCLPFSATVPSGIDVRELVRMEEGELTFQPVTEIRAHVPVILRCENPSGEAVTFVSKAGVVSSPPASLSAFIPVYQHLEISSATEGVYLLSGQGETFSLADFGSTLRPFRAYIKLE